MPLYEYQCDACGRRFEKIRKFSDPPLDVCPFCGSGPIQKLVSSPAFTFKGSGFYATDYKGLAAESEKGGTASAADGGKSEKSENKDGAPSKESKDSKDTKESNDSKHSKDAKPATSDSGAAKPSSPTSSPSKDSSSSSTTKS